eukprot:Awhi_evm1s12928
MASRVSLFRLRSSVQGYSQNNFWTLQVPGRSLTNVAKSNDVVNDSPNFSFSGSGFLLPYHLGVCNFLQSKDLFQPSSRYAGASGGSIIALILAAGLDLEIVRESLDKVSAKCIEHGTRFNLEMFLTETLREHEGEVDYTFLNKNKKLTIATTKVGYFPTVHQNNFFDSNEDVIQCILTSCYLPSYSTNKLVRLFRNENHVDGGFIQLVPKMLDGNFINICCYPAHYLGKSKVYHISPSLLNRSERLSFASLLWYTMTPPPPEVVDQLVKMGEDSAKIWYELDGHKRLSLI